MDTTFKSVQVNLRMNPVLKIKAEEAAIRDNRSLASLMEFLLIQHLREGSRLETFHELSAQRYEDVIQGGGPPGGHRGRRHLSFAVRPADLGAIAPSALLGTIREALADMEGWFRTTTMFEPYHPKSIAPHFAQLRDGGEVLESWLEPGVHENVFERDYWCISPAALGSHIKPLQEDRRDSERPHPWFSPFMLVRDVFQLVLFARFLGAAAGKGGFIEFRCDWDGLKGRELADSHSDIPIRPGHVARQDGRQTTARFAVDALADPLIAAAVADLCGPTLRLFDPGFVCDVAWVTRQTHRFRG